MQLSLLIFGTGFIAGSLIDYYKKLNNKHKIVVLYNKHKIDNKNNVVQYSMDDNIEEILQREKPNYIFIVHGNSFVANNTNIELSINDNMLKSALFLEKLYETKNYENIKKILIVGSASEYGKFYDKPIKEDFTLHPTSLYGLSKIFLYNTAMYFVEKGLPIVYVRQFNTIGLMQRENFVLSSFCKTVVEIENSTSAPIISVGDLSQERDFLDIRDTCIAYDLIIHNGIIGQVYNVASGEYSSIEELLKQVIKLSNLKNKEIYINENINLFAKEVSLSRRLHADVTKLQALGFRRKYTLTETIRDTLNYWRNNVR